MLALAYAYDHKQFDGLLVEYDDQSSVDTLSMILRGDSFIGYLLSNRTKVEAIVLTIMELRISNPRNCTVSVFAASTTEVVVPGLYSLDFELYYGQNHSSRLARGIFCSFLPPEMFGG